MISQKKALLFLCTGNSARSQMAEAYLRRYADDYFDIYSAGLRPQGINPYTIEVMDEVGIDIRQQTSDSVKDFMGKMSFRYLITVCADADENCPQPLWHRSGVKLHWGFEDPAKAIGTDEEIRRKFREIRDQIDAKIKEWLAELELPYE